MNYFESVSILGSNLLRRWHQLQLKLICEEMQAAQLVNCRQAGEETQVKSLTMHPINKIIPYTDKELCSNTPPAASAD